MVLKNSKSRRDLILTQLVLSNPRASEHDGPRVKLVIGTRAVCREIFCAHWCIGPATLERFVRRVRSGDAPLQSQSAENGQKSALDRECKKRHSVVSWFTQYAEEIHEKLPDSDKVLLPRVMWKDMHKQYADDMAAAGYDGKYTAAMSHFRRTFDRAPELVNMEITRYKRNFSRCSVCIQLTSDVNAALKGHDCRKIEKAKTARLEHYIIARSDKLHYWQQRWQARSPVALKLTLIIDKMDSAKNRIPWFSDGRKPKDIDNLLKDVLRLHVTGVIIHGKPDARYIFWSLPFMPGNANLNLECLRRALVYFLRNLTFRPKLYLQFDNASDNKNFTTLCLAGWLVMQGLVSQARPPHECAHLDHMTWLPRPPEFELCEEESESVSLIPFFLCLVLWTG